MNFKFRLNPICKKELLLESRSLKIPLLIIIYNLFLSIVGIICFYIAFGEKSGYAIAYKEMIGTYDFMLTIEFIIILFAVPAYSASMVSREYEKNTMGVILTTRMSLIKIITGKLTYVVIVVSVLVSSSLPIIAMAFCAGGKNILDLLIFVALVAITTMFIGSIGILFSTILMVTKNAILLSYVVLLAITLGTYSIEALIYSTIDSSRSWGMLTVVLLVNPLFNIFKLAGTETFDRWVGEICNSQNLIDNWLLISCIVQIIFSIAIVILTVWISKVRHSGTPLSSLRRK